MGQIGTIRVDTQNNGTVSVPVFDTGDSGSSIYEFVRVQTANGTGFIPVEDTGSATYPFLRVRSQSHGTVAMTDRSTAIPDGLVARYLFENNGTDKTGGSTNTYVSDTTSYDLTFQNGVQFGSSFNGTTAYYATDDEDFATNPDIFLGSDPAFSVSMWVYRTKDWVNDGTFSLGGGGGNNLSINSYIQPENENEIGFDLYSQSRFYGGVEYPLNEWAHVVHTYAGGGMNPTTLSCYLNGQEITLTQQRDGSTSPNVTSSFNISSIQNSNRDFSGGTGRYEDVMLFNREITQQEVLNIYNSTKP